MVYAGLSGAAIGAGAGYGKEGCDEFVSVDEDDRNGDAGFDAVCSQDICKAVDLGIEFVV